MGLVGPLRRPWTCPSLPGGEGSYWAVILLLWVVESGGGDSLPSSSGLANGAGNWDPILPSGEGKRCLLIDPTFIQLSLPVLCLAFPSVKWAPRQEALTWHSAGTQ